MSRWRRQQRKRAGQRRWLEKRFAEFQELFAKEMHHALTDLFIQIRASGVTSPRDMIQSLHAAVDRYTHNPPSFGPPELIKLEYLYK